MDALWLLPTTMARWILFIESHYQLSGLINVPIVDYGHRSMKRCFYGFIIDSVDGFEPLPWFVLRYALSPEHSGLSARRGGGALLPALARCLLVSPCSVSH